MTSQHDLASQALADPSLIEEMQFLDHRIWFGQTHTGWVSFIARKGQRPTILLAPDRDILMAETRSLIKRRNEAKRREDAAGCQRSGDHRGPLDCLSDRRGLPFPVSAPNRS